MEVDSMTVGQQIKNAFLLEEGGKDMPAWSI